MILARYLCYLRREEGGYAVSIKKIVLVSMMCLAAVVVLMPEIPLVKAEEPLTEEVTNEELPQEGSPPPEERSPQEEVKGTQALPPTPQTG